MPPFVIFHDASLQEMATYFPHSVEAFKQMHGVGQAKVEKYADIFLSIIRAYCQEHGLTEKPKSTNRSTHSSTTLRPRYREVGERFQNGESIDELMRVYRVKRYRIVLHLDKYAQEGNPLPLERLRAESQLSSETQARALAAFDELGAEFLRPVFEALNGMVDYDELHLMRAIYWSQTLSP
jgi:ATP-dependent DNA helicase RecQ